MVIKLDHLVTYIAKPAYKQRGFAEQRIITDWPMIVGELVARYSQPKKLSFPKEAREHGVLLIEVYDSAFATELHFLGPLIIDKLAAYFGYKAVGSITIQHRPASLPDEKSVFYEDKPELSEFEALQIVEVTNGFQDPDVSDAMQALTRWHFWRKQVQSHRP